MNAWRTIVWAGLLAGPAVVMAPRLLMPPPPRVATPAVAVAMDYGDFASATLTIRAWEALRQGDHAGVEAYVRMCATLYGEEAGKQQAGLTTLLPAAEAFSAWALNDVATAEFILGESLRARRRFDEARAVFARLVQDYPSAQCWDPRGWFWSVAHAAQVRLDHALRPAAP